MVGATPGSFAEASASKASSALGSACGRSAPLPANATAGADLLAEEPLTMASGLANASAAKRRSTTSCPQRSSDKMPSIKSATPWALSSGANFGSTAKRANAFSSQITAGAGPTACSTRKLSTVSRGNEGGLSLRCGRHSKVVSATPCMSVPRLASCPKRCQEASAHSAAPAAAACLEALCESSSVTAQHSCATSALWPPRRQTSSTSGTPPALRRRSVGALPQHERMRCNATNEFDTACQCLQGSAPPMPRNTALRSCTPSNSRAAASKAARRHSSLGLRSSARSMATALATLGDRIAPKAAFIKAMQNSDTASLQR
mmetsp:Transcript_129418/g.414819  ORF Transcript_129418/g.414819 Transcript_129418/m.414819 type:complete len:318 (+) Transcript_129418:1339-2292(+)